MFPEDSKSIELKKDKQMKKVIFALLALMLATGAMAQQKFYEQSIGVRAGLNISKMKTDGVTYDANGGFHVGGVYQRLLTKKAPIYLETGLYLSQKGYKVDGANKCNAYYLEVPLLVNYKFVAGKEFTLYPSAGFYYGLGVGGKVKTMGEKIDTFSDNGLERSDFGVRASFTGEWRQFLLSAGYDYSLFDAGKVGKMKHRTFFLSVGYNF